MDLRSKKEGTRTTNAGVVLHYTIFHVLVEKTDTKNWFIMDGEFVHEASYSWKSVNKASSSLSDDGWRKGSDSINQMSVQSHDIPYLSKLTADRFTTYGQKDCIKNLQSHDIQLDQLLALVFA